jgi:alkylation response protein AidB-like acyl-CoA dehydrogenase
MSHATATLAAPVALSTPAPALEDTVRALAKARLAPLAVGIDEGDVYPDDVLRAFGDVGAWRSHTPHNGNADLRDAIRAMAAIGETCGATAFMAWCQDTLGWYVANSDNARLRDRFAEAVTSGRTLGGTGLSNPMKSFFGIETLKLKGRRVEGGFIVRGALPWVSNLGPDHLFGTICTIEGEDATCMFIADCADPAITLTPCKPFLAMDGTGTYGVQFRDVFVPDELVIAAPAAPFVKKIRAGFILLQMGMALGLIRDCIVIMRGVAEPLGHVNRFLPQQPENFQSLLDELESETMTLASDPYDSNETYWRRVVALRLRAGEASVAAAHAAMLHCGARGYLKSHRAQRRLREAYFVAIVTPATKQLRKMLAEH